MLQTLVKPNLLKVYRLDILHISYSNTRSFIPMKGLPILHENYEKVLHRLDAALDLSFSYYPKFSNFDFVTFIGTMHIR
jgi:hypothetical protein